MRGKKHELEVLKSLSTSIVDKAIVTPIIEPVNRNLEDLKRAKGKFQEEQMPYMLIFNPQVGDLHSDQTSLNLYQSSFEELLTSQAIPAFVINESLDFSSNLIEKYNNDKPVALIHYGEYSAPNNIDFDDAYHLFIQGRTSEEYERSFINGEKIIIQDGFIKRRRNVDYPEEEFFSDIQLTYTEKGYSGFGDYLMIGEEHVSGGRSPYAVTIHLTFPIQDSKIKIKHFVSDTVTPSASDAAPKYLEALKKLIFFGKNKPSVNFTSGFNDFVNSYNNNHYPGLGKAKEFSMKHHIELMQKCLSRLGH